MNKLLNKFFNLRKGEITLTVLMFSYIYLILVTYYLLKPARDSLFLAEIGPNQLPIVFILIAIIAIPVNLLYSKASRKFKLNYLINLTTITIIICILILRWLVILDSSWVYYLFYIWVSIYGVMTVSQFWLFANAIYNSAQAKRIFITLNLGAIFGAFTGGEITGIIVKTFNVKTENLLFFCVGFLAITIFLVNTIWAIKKKEVDDTIKPKKIKQESKEKLSDLFSILKKSRYLVMIMGIIAMTMATGSFVDYQFKVITFEAFPERSDLTSFLGTFYGRLSLASLLLQSLFSYRFLKILGVGGIIMILPTALILGSLTMLFIPGLFAGVLLRGSDGAFKYSLDKTGRELLFLPVPLEVKKKTKIIIDVIIDRWFRGVAGGLLILFVTVLEFSVSQLSIVVLVLLAIWLTFAIFIRKEYVNAFRRAIDKRNIDSSQLTVNISDPNTINTVKDLLNSDNERQLIYALDLLKSVSDVDFSENVVRLLKHESNVIRLRAIQALHVHNHPEFENDVKEVLNDEDPEVRLEAVSYLYIYSTNENRSDLLEVIFNTGEAKLKSSAIRFVAERGTEGEKQLVTSEIVESLLSDKSEFGSEVRIQLAKSLPYFKKIEFNNFILQMVTDPSNDVVKSVVISLGHTKDRRFVPILIDKLSDKNFRNEARIALSLFGNGILGTLRDYVSDKNVPINLRRNIPKILFLIPSQESVNVLTACLTESEPLLRFSIIKSLNKLRAGYPGLEFDDDKLDGALLQETEDYYHTLQILEKYKTSNDTDESKLLIKALNEKLDKNFEKIFRILGLVYPPVDIFNAYQRIISPSRNLRANAYEFLDNILISKSKKHLIPIMDVESSDPAIDHGKKSFNLKLKTQEQALIYLIQGKDPWLKICAIFNVQQDCSDDMLNLLKQAQTDDASLIRESANKVISKINQS